MLGFEQFSWLK